MDSSKSEGNKTNKKNEHEQTIDLHPQLSLKQKITYVFIFLGGLIFSYPSLFPIGIILACILLFKKDNIKINILGLVVIFFLFLNIFIFHLLLNIMEV